MSMTVAKAMARMEIRAKSGDLGDPQEFANDLALIRTALPPLDGLDEPTRLFANPSWPQGEWRVQYGPATDRYHIITDKEQRIARVRPTLVAYWLVRTYNRLRIVFPLTRDLGATIRSSTAKCLCRETAWTSTPCPVHGHAGPQGKDPS